MVEPTNLEFDDHILCVEYESLPYGLDENEGLDVGFYLQYKPFCLEPIISALILKKSKPEECKNFVRVTVNFD